MSDDQVRGTRAAKTLGEQRRIHRFADYTPSEALLGDHVRQGSSSAGVNHSCPSSNANNVIHCWYVVVAQKLDLLGDEITSVFLRLSR
jgi:hypothetical protein